MFLESEHRSDTVEQRLGLEWLAHVAAGAVCERRDHVVAPICRGGDEIVAGSLNIMSERITRSRLAGEPADAVIQPRLSAIGLLEYHRGAEAIAEGRATAELAIPLILRQLQYPV